CKVPRGLLLIPDKVGELPVDGSPFSGGRLHPQNGSKERVRESDARSLDPDDLCGDCLLECLGRKECGCWTRAGRDTQQLAPWLGRDRGEPPRDELPQVSRHRQRVGGPEVARPCAKGARDLERVERISAARLVQSQESRARKRDADALVDELLQRARAQRAEREALAFELGRWLAMTFGPLGHEQSHSRCQPSGDELE